MKSLLLLGLTGLAANVQAHPQRRQPNNNAVLSKRGVDIDAFRMPQLSDYKGAKVTKESDAIASISKRDASYIETATEAVKAVAPGAEFRVVKDHYVGSNGIAHVNFRQTVHGIDIDNADFNVNVGKDGKIFSFGNSFFTGDLPTESPLTKREFSDPETALKGVISALGLSIEIQDIVTEAKDDVEQYLFSGTSGTGHDPEAKLVYFVKGDGDLALTWRVETDVTDNWLLTYIDASSNEDVHGVVDYVSDFATYQVYPWGINDPTEGDRIVIEDPWNLETSEFTWNGDGSNYTTTRGNNGIAQVNPSGGDTYENNYRPNSPDLDFEYEYTTDMADPDSYKDAAITQLFYTGNKYHDLLYTLGFTEEAGNFETNTNGQGGAGNDFVVLNAQDGSGTNNANFLTPPDGSPGRMRMYLWDASTPVRDCAFEAGVVIHEYTHGLSTRLTGGPSNSGCLSTIEAGGMGEGWSDFFATTIRLKKNDTRATDYPMGAWVSNEAGGIRSYPYSTSTTVNPLTYKSADEESNVHGVGTVWCTALYEVLWNLIDKHGKDDADFPTFDDNGIPIDGKYLSLKLVMDGMALQPCSPTMVQARDAIIDADEALTGGDNACELWTAFAKRGLGENAKFGSGSRTEDFTVPSGVC